MKRNSALLGEVTQSLGNSFLARRNGLASFHPAEFAERRGWTDTAAIMRAPQGVIIGGPSGFVIGEPRANVIIGDIPRDSLSAELLDVARPLPGFYSRYLVTEAQSLVAEELTQGMAIPVAKTAASSIVVTPTTIGIVIPMSEESIRDSDAAAAIHDNGVQAIQRGLDAVICALLSPGSAGGDAATSKPTDDLRKLLTALNATGTFKPILVGAPDTMVTMACLRDGGGQVFPECGPTGGYVMTCPTFVNDRLAASSLLGINPEALAFKVGDIEVAISQNASLQLDTAPSQDASTGTGSAMSSMFQSYAVALRITVAYSLLVLRGENVSEAITSIGWAN